jgi:hypothetical protein
MHNLQAQHHCILTCSGGTNSGRLLLVKPVLTFVSCQPLTPRSQGGVLLSTHTHTPTYPRTHAPGARGSLSTRPSTSPRLTEYCPGPGTSGSRVQISVRVEIAAKSVARSCMHACVKGHSSSRLRVRVVRAAGKCEREVRELSKAPCGMEACTEEHTQILRIGILELCLHAHDGDHESRRKRHVYACVCACVCVHDTSRVEGREYCPGAGPSSLCAKSALALQASHTDRTTRGNMTNRAHRDTRTHTHQGQTHGETCPSMP